MTHKQLTRKLKAGTISATEALLEARKIAFYNTYGKGIHPESVEKMKNVLQKIQDWTETAANFPYAELKEALTASKNT